MDARPETHGQLIVHAILRGTITPEQWYAVLFNPSVGYLDTGEGYVVVEVRGYPGAERLA